MKRRSFIVLAIFLGVRAVKTPGLAQAFSAVDKATLRASATITAGQGGAAFTIQASTLPGTAFFGKNVVIPVRVTTNPNGLRVDIVYQLLDANGALLGPPVGVPISFSPDPARANSLVGSAIIPADQLSAIRAGGQLTYIFVGRQGLASSMLTAFGPSSAPDNITTLPTPFQTAITDHICGPVTPTGSRISAPDLFVNDGQTSVSLAPGAVKSPDTLCIKIEDINGWPSGPGGTKATAIYSMTLQQTTLTGPAVLALSYPADIRGKVLDSGAEPGSLGIYTLDQANKALPGGNWRALSRATIDTTLHTVTGTTSHLSTFGLFPAGAVGAAALRPSERIITPNGDGINDTVTFAGLAAQEEVHIFDVRGRRVRTLTGASPVWNGTDDDGKIVESGVYLYQYSSLGERVSGVIGVAK